MKARLFCVVCAAVAVGAALPARGVTTNTFYVAEGQTLTVDQVVAASNFTFEAGDWIRKTGKGQLNAVTTYKDTKINFLIEEGVYYVGGSDKQYCHKAATLVIKAGATVNVDGKTTHQFNDSWTVYFEGNGTGEGDNLGAICIGGGQTNPTIASGGNFYMTGDATIGGLSRLDVRGNSKNSIVGPTNVTLTVKARASNESGLALVGSKVSVGKIVVADVGKVRYESTTVLNVPYGIDLYGMFMFNGGDGTWNTGGVFVRGASASIGNNSGDAYMRTPLIVTEGATLTMNGSATTHWTARSADIISVLRRLKAT